MGLGSARSSSRDFRPSNEHGRGRAESSPLRPLPAGHGARPGPRAGQLWGSRSWAGELCREQGAQLGGVSRRPGRLRRQQVRILSARGTFVQLGRLPPAPELPGARRLQGVRLVRTSRRSGARTPARDTKRPRGPGGRPAPNGSPCSLSARTPSVADSGARGAPGSRGGAGRRPRTGVPGAAGARAARIAPRPPRAWSRRGGAGAQPMQGGRSAGRRPPPLPPRPASVAGAPGLLPLPRPTRRRHLVYLLPRPAPPLRRTPAAGPPPAAPTCTPVGRAYQHRPHSEPYRHRPLGHLDPGGPRSGDWFSFGPVPGWLLLAHWPAETPVKWRGREAGAGR